MNFSAWDECQGCSLHKTAFRKSLPKLENGADRGNCSVLFLGYFPGKSEACLGQSFSGPTGRFLSHKVREFLGEIPVAYTNLLLCRPFLSESRVLVRPPRPAEIDACSEHTCSLLMDLKPKVLVIFGEQTGKLLIHRKEFSDYTRHGITFVTVPASFYELQPDNFSIGELLGDVADAIENPANWLRIVNRLRGKNENGNG